ncbi:MAG: hypothetical protein ACHP7E_01880, partial [Burkholderiales bacterium]
LRNASENINVAFDVEKQTYITDCPRCAGTALLPPGENRLDTKQQGRERHHGYDTANYPGRFHGPLVAG